MCLGRSRAPEPEKDPVVEQELESKEVIEEKKKEENKQKALEAKVAVKRGGTGRRSLLTGGGGIGYFNKYKGMIG